jgi:hypothetical protein
VKELLNDIKFRFTLKTLKALCQAANLPVSGNKPMLQDRLRVHLQKLLERQVSVKYQVVKAAAEAERAIGYGTVSNRYVDWNRSCGLMRIGLG